MPPQKRLRLHNCQGASPRRQYRGCDEKPEPVERRAFRVRSTPLGRPGQPAEIAPVYVLLASAEATDVTGQVYGASGGRGEP